MCSGSICQARFAEGIQRLQRLGRIDQPGRRPGVYSAEAKHLDGLVVEDAPTVRISQPGLGEQRILLSLFMSPRPDFLHSHLASQGLIDSVEYGRDRICVFHAVDLSALFDYHEG